MAVLNITTNSVCLESEDGLEDEVGDVSKGQGMTVFYFYFLFPILFCQLSAFCFIL